MQSAGNQSLNLKISGSSWARNAGQNAACTENEARKVDTFSPCSIVISSRHGRQTVFSHFLQNKKISRQTNLSFINCSIRPSSGPSISKTRFFKRGRGFYISFHFYTDALLIRIGPNFCYVEDLYVTIRCTYY